MNKEGFYKHLDSLTKGIGFDFGLAEKAFIYQAAKTYYELNLEK